MHNVDYVNTFILVADDTAASHGAEPPVREPNPSIPARQFAMIRDHPYRYTSGDVIFDVYADRAGIPHSQRAAARDEYFSKGRPCLRASDLGKKYGWGIHCDGKGRLALYAVESPDYSALVQKGERDGTPALVKAMRSSRK
ncbi:MAG: DUF6157 family protein [Chloroflexota bacterium]|nr:DUF6157 family protein [Chloroflexota bacterium]